MGRLAGSWCDAGTSYAEETWLRLHARAVGRMLWLIRNRFLGIVLVLQLRRSRS